MKYYRLNIVCLLFLLFLACPVLAQQKVDLNTATVEQLVELKGVGEVIAQRIIDYRLEHKGFKSIEELAQVKGVGGKTLDQLKPLLVVNEVKQK